MDGYNRRFDWMSETYTTEQTIGAPQEAWKKVGSLWGSLAFLRANELLAYGARQSVASVKIKIKGYRVKLKFVDRLVDRETSDTWLIDGLFADKENDELVVTAHRLGEPNAFEEG